MPTINNENITNAEHFIFEYKIVLFDLIKKVFFVIDKEIENKIDPKSV